MRMPPRNHLPTMVWILEIVRPTPKIAWAESNVFEVRP